MPASFHENISYEGYSHILNKGVNTVNIFRDHADYETFLDYLREYITPASNHQEITKKTFTVKGRTFRGVPHQPKNYHGSIELVAYSLTPTNFHLLIHQVETGSVQKFMRSFCTRYSIYYNKKYHRTGPLFEGPYKSVPVKNSSGLRLLTQNFHRYGDSSSYEAFLGKKKIPWVKPKIVMDSFLGAQEYQRFVEDYEPNEEEKKTLSKNKAIHDIVPEIKARTKPGIFEFAVALGGFIILLGIGVRNIQVSNASTLSSVATPTALGVETNVPQLETEPIPPPIETPPIKTMVVVRIKDGSESVNIRNRPSVGSEKIAKAYEDDTFEYISIDSNWYEIRLPDESIGFISGKYVEKVIN